MAHLRPPAMLDGPPPRLRDRSDHIDLRMRGKAGQVILHYSPKGVEWIEYREKEDARATPENRDG